MGAPQRLPTDEPLQFAWGPPEIWHRGLSTRFRRLQIQHPFYVDMDTKKIVHAIPKPNSRVKHTQGLLAETVELHLASIFRAALQFSFAGS